MSLTEGVVYEKNAQKTLDQRGRSTVEGGKEDLKPCQGFYAPRKPRELDPRQCPEGDQGKIFIKVFWPSGVVGPKKRRRRKGRETVKGRGRGTMGGVPAE